MQQLFGFPWYLAANITASPGSLSKPQSTKFLGNSHFLPSSSLFRPEEAHLILLSDIGIGLTAMGLWLAATKLGFHMIVLLYLQPYLWVNHWIVAITYLHHTHPKLPKYEPEAWTFLKGATATVDREFGLIGKYMFHGIIEFHVIHHLFSYVKMMFDYSMLIADPSTDASLSTMQKKRLMQSFPSWVAVITRIRKDRFFQETGNPLSNVNGSNQTIGLPIRKIGSCGIREVLCLH